MCSVPPASSCPMSAAAIAPSTAPSPSTQPGMMTAVTPNTTCARAPGGYHHAPNTTPTPRHDCLDSAAAV